MKPQMSLVLNFQECVLIMEYLIQLKPTAAMHHVTVACNMNVKKESFKIFVALKIQCLPAIAAAFPVLFMIQIFLSVQMVQSVKLLVGDPDVVLPAVKYAIQATIVIYHLSAVQDLKQMIFLWSNTIVLTESRHA
mmetsp:Transcript_174/g.272  ORF Transcript_174/g.272 Transcript_174/m.272 type:complete len:135 (+) Transcript_174:67-471(+)